MYYRFYFVGDDNRIRHAVNLDCEDDAKAIEAAEAIDRQAFAAELWEKGRLVKKFPPRPVEA